MSTGDGDVRREPSGLAELSTAECMVLLGAQVIGRLGVVVDGYPLIFPVNYRLDGEVVVIRTDLGQKLAAAQGRNVTFEVDSFDPSQLSGWSVMVLGIAEEVTTRRDAETRERAVRIAPAPWPAGDRPYVLRIIPRAVTGRRIQQTVMNEARGFDAGVRP